MAPPLKSSTAASIFRTIAFSRYSARRFQPNKEIPSPILQNILQTTLTSPSGFNLQPTHVILVQCPKIKQQLSKNAMLGAGNIFRTSDASALAVFLADLEPNKRIPAILELEQKSQSRPSGYIASYSVVSSFLLGEGQAATLFKQMTTDAMSPIKPMPTIDPVQSWSYKNTSLMAQTYVLAATSHGLATCIMEGFDARRMKQILNIPDRYDIPLTVATGYEYEGNDMEPFKRTPRLEFSQVFFDNSFGQPLTFQNEVKTNDTDFNDDDNEAKKIKMNTIHSQNSKI